MVLLCVTVVDALHRKSLLSWEIVQSQSDTESILEFFDSMLITMLYGQSNFTASEVPRVSSYIISCKC